MTEAVTVMLRAEHELYISGASSHRLICIQWPVLRPTVNGAYTVCAPIVRLRGRCHGANRFTEVTHGI